ncbi:MAG: hypothetical protein IT371_02555 [Deltaproteobacteria bacterium]|nr:hypothetical protein [Deltaproteobacteria bacterium]
MGKDSDPTIRDEGPPASMARTAEEVAVSGMVEPEDLATRVWAGRQPPEPPQGAPKPPSSAGVRLAPSVEVAGAEGEAAIRLAEQLQREREADPTLIVPPPPGPKLDHECRMCGWRTTVPQRRRGLRRLVRSETGYRCEVCGEVFCGVHVVRTSGPLESVLRGQRVVCLLCLPPPRRDA